MDTNTCALESLIMGIVFADAKQQHELFVEKGLGCEYISAFLPLQMRLWTFVLLFMTHSNRPYVKGLHISVIDDDDGVMSVRFSTGTTMECLIKSWTRRVHTEINESGTMTAHPLHIYEPLPPRMDVVEDAWRSIITYSMSRILLWCSLWMAVE